MITELDPQVQSLDLLMKVLYLFGLQGHFENKSYSCVNHVANSKDLDWKSSQKMNLTYTKKQFDYIKVEWVIHLKLILKNRSSHLISCRIELRKYEPVRTLLSPQEIMAFDLPFPMLEINIKWPKTSRSKSVQSPLPPLKVYYSTTSTAFPPR